MKLKDWVIPFVLFGPVMMVSSSWSTTMVGMILAAASAIILGLGCAIMYRQVELQGKEIERLRAQLVQRPQESGAA